MRDALGRILRALILLLLFFLPKPRKLRLERWLRGREDLRRLRRADCVVVSFGKSGRTWLRVMLSRFFQVKHDLPEGSLIGFENLHRKNPAIPKILFTHDNYLKDYTGTLADKSDYAHSKVVLLVRHPADVAVSQYFQWKHRMRPAKKVLNDYPPHGADTSLFDFVMRESSGLPKIIGFMNAWAKSIPDLPSLLVVRYEDMRARPEESLGKILEFIGSPASPTELSEVVEFARFDNMKKLESRRVFWLSGGRMVPGDRSDPNSYKVRRAKVGGYRDDFDAGELAQIDTLVAKTLDPRFGYDGPSDSRASAPAASGSAGG
ncbi:sulfotransferase domain-containing protein [Algihabitans albus]|uniref:sulfotransferase domain-containing protein n=1 Tax=Algihabitans albus TaxID=2164067 RepID=UPI000E5D47BD|nr:sulfotransferase domain-containing protein [Algihabitans albus]